MQGKFVATEKAWFWGERTFCLEGNVNVHSGGFFAPLGRVEEPPIRNTSTFHQKYLYFSLKIPLLFLGSSSTSLRTYFHFLSEVPPLPLWNASTSPRELLHFLPDVMLFLSERLLTLLILKSIPHRKAPPPSLR